jgi:Fic family protein
MVPTLMHIIKKKKGKKEYFYLQYSYRENKKVVTKQKYLGTRLPENLEEIKQKFRRESVQRLYQKLERIHAHFQKEWMHLPKSVKEKELEQIAVAFTYNTNAIEGSTITLEEAREIIEDKIAPHKSLQDIKETEAHARVFIEMLKKKERISHELLLHWHKNIFSETKSDIAGKYRDYLVRVGNYRAPDWQDVQRMMNGLILYIHKNSTLNPVELTARAHYRFEKIHPFGDGNGRIGRLLMNHILWYQGYPMLIIEYVKRKSYYKALQKDEEGFLSYFFRRYLAIHKKRYNSKLSME